jgi:hypothetical protein
MPPPTEQLDTQLDISSLNFAVPSLIPGAEPHHVVPPAVVLYFTVDVSHHLIFHYPLLSS